MLSASRRFRFVSGTVARAPVRPSTSRPDDSYLSHTLSTLARALGCHLVVSRMKRRSSGLGRPSSRTCQAGTPLRFRPSPLPAVRANLNRFLTGWGGYFRRGNSTTPFRKLDRSAVERLGRFVDQRHGFKRPLTHGRWRRQQGHLGLRPLVGRVRHSAAHAAR